MFTYQKYHSLVLKYQEQQYLIFLKKACLIYKNIIPYHEKIIYNISKKTERRMKSKNDYEFQNAFHLFTNIIQYCLLKFHL